MSALARKRFARADWLALGLAVLRDHGPDSITLDALCAHAGKTKGSFYFHFDSVETFTAALADAWREDFTLRLIRAADGKPGLGRKLDHLNTLAMELDRGVEQAMRLLAARDAGVAAVVADVDARCIAYMAGLYAASGRYGMADAKSLATIEYAAFVGLQQLMPDAPPRALKKLYDNVLRLTGRVRK